MKPVPREGRCLLGVRRWSRAQIANERCFVGPCVIQRKGPTMSRELVPTNNKPVFSDLHPRIYGIAAALVGWFVLSAWALFDRGGYVGLQLTFVSFLLLMAVLLPWTLSEVWRKHRKPYQRHQQKASLRDWAAGSFDVWGARIRGSHAAIDALLPLAAVAFGLTAIGIVFVIVSALT